MGRFKVLQRLGEVTGDVEQEADPLVRAGVPGIEAERDVPLVERPLEIALVAEDAGQQVVRVGQVGIPGQAGERDLFRRVELPATAQRLPERQEDEARRIGRELGRQDADVFNAHGVLPVRP